MLNLIVVIDLYSCTCIIQWHFCLIFFSVTVDFVIPEKGESLLEAYEKWRKWADEKGTSYSFPYLPGFTNVGIPVQCQCIWWKHHYIQMQNGFDHQVHKLHVHCCTFIFYCHKTYRSLDWLKPLKTFWYTLIVIPWMLSWLC